MLGIDTTLIISKSKASLKALADSVGSDIVSRRCSYPLNFKQLEEKDTRPNAPVADGYSTRYGEIINCSGFCDVKLTQFSKEAVQFTKQDLQSGN